MRQLIACLCLLLVAWAPAPLERRPPPGPPPGAVRPGRYQVRWNGVEGTITLFNNNTYFHLNGSRPLPNCCYEGFWEWDHRRRVLTLFDRMAGGGFYCRCDVRLDLDLEGDGPSDSGGGRVYLKLWRLP